MSSPAELLPWPPGLGLHPPPCSLHNPRTALITLGGNSLATCLCAPSPWAPCPSLHICIPMSSQSIESVLSKDLLKNGDSGKNSFREQWEQSQTTGKWSKNGRWVLETVRRVTSSRILLKKGMAEKGNGWKRTPVGLGVYFVRWERLQYI